MRLKGLDGLLRTSPYRAVYEQWGVSGELANRLHPGIVAISVVAAVVSGSIRSGIFC